MSPVRLALSNLTQQPARTLVSLVGVAFAVLLVFMQLGFLGSLLAGATLLFDQLGFDLLLVSSEYITLNRSASFPRARLAQARAAQGVRDVQPLTASLGLWREPRAGPAGDEAHPGRRWSIMILAVDPPGLPRLFSRPVGTVVKSEEELHHHAATLAIRGNVLMDETSRKEYGNRRLWLSGSAHELNDHRVQIAGLVRVGTGFAYNGLLITSESTLTHVQGWPPERVSFGLVRLAEGADVERARQELCRLLPPDVQVMTREKINSVERDYWMGSTAVGQFFIAGVVIALLVGGIFVYQMMAADITRRLPEYATILALGYPGRYLTRVVYAQGLLLALVGYVPGMITSLLCYSVTRQMSGAPIEMNPFRLVLVLALTVGMCMGSAITAVRGVRRANPADLF